MAKRRSSTALAVRTVSARAPSPIIRIAAPRSAPRKKHRRRGGGQLGTTDPMKLALAGGIYGLVKKQGLLDKLPEIPVLGRTGTVALICWYWGKHGGGNMVRQVGQVAAVLAGYQLGFEGTVSGDDDGRVLTADDY